MGKSPFSELADQARSTARKGKKEFADALGVNDKVVRNWENGTIPHRDNLRKLAEVVPSLSGVTDYLLEHYDDWKKGTVDWDKVRKLRRNLGRAGIESHPRPMHPMSSGRYSEETRREAHEALDNLFDRADSSVVEDELRRLFRRSAEFGDPTRVRSKRK